MRKYTAEDFDKARFATRGSSTAMWSNHDGHWRTSGDGIYNNSAMAHYGWTPVQESSELTIDRVWDEWKAAEVITADNLPRTGDTIIILDPHRGSYTIAQWHREWNNPEGVIGERILRRAPRRPEGAEDIEALLQTIWDAGMSLPEAADKLAEHVEVTN